MWNTETGEESFVLLGHKADVTALHMTEGGGMIFSGDASGTLLVCDLGVVSTCCVLLES